MSNRCEQCGVVRVIKDGDPPANQWWCSHDCTQAWFDADPTRREGWISLSDLTLEQIGDAFKRSGLELAGVGERDPS